MAFPANNYFRLQHFIAYISHVSPKGYPVGYVFFEGKWWGPLAWNPNGSSQLKRSSFDAQDGKFQASNCLAGNMPVFQGDIYSVKDLLKNLKDKKSQ